MGNGGLEVSAPTFLQFVGSLGVRLTRAQRVLAVVAFDGVDPIDLPPEDRGTATAIFGPVDRIPTAARAVLVAVCGARSGKSYVLSALYSLWRSFVADLSRLAPGEQAVALVVAPDLRLARQVIRYAEGAAKSVPSIARLIEGATADGFTLRRPDGGRVSIEALPATRGGSAVRGRSLVSAVLDESAFFLSEDYTVSDVDVFKAVAPRVLPGGMVVLASTPWGEAGLLFSEFQRNHGHPETAVAAHAPTLLMRDHDPSVAAVVRREEERDPDNADREYGAKFGASSENLLAPDDVEAAIQNRGENERAQGVRYACAIDLATRHDYSVLLVGHREHFKRAGGPAVDVLAVDVARHWKPGLLRKLDVDELEREIAEYGNAFRAKTIDADSWGFDFFASRMASRGLTLEEQSMSTTEQTRRFQLLATLFRQRRILLPNEPELAKQLKALRAIRTAGGTMRFASHDKKRIKDDYPKALSLLAARVMGLGDKRGLPVGGGNIAFRTVRGQRQWFHVDEHGNETPASPPLGSKDWLKLCYRSQVEGWSSPEIEAWMAEPANREAVTRYAERAAARARALAALRRPL